MSDIITEDLYDFEVDYTIFKKTNDEEEIDLKQVLDFSTVKRIESLMVKAMPALKFTHKSGNLDNFIDEVNRHFSPIDMTVNMILESVCDDSLPDVTEKIYSYLDPFNEFIEALTELIENLDLEIDIKVYRRNIFNLIFLKNGEPYFLIETFA